jgi:ectoine hydroxylase-related dioxygenase (phytanoyl-CoA dioxygenase family)
MPEAFEDKVAFFEREGFLIIPNVLGAAEVAELDQELRRLAANHATLPRIREGFGLEPNQDGSRPTPTFRKIGGITELSPAFDRLCKHPRVLDLLHAIMGPTIQLWRDVCMMKPARVGREKPWHQDSSYWPWEPMSLVSAMTALDHASPENGCLQIIPRTHHDALQHYGQELQVDIEGDLQARTVYVPLKAGDTLLFHSLLLHASEPNHSDQDRRVCIISYKTPKVEYIGKGDERDCPMVSQR